MTIYVDLRNAGVPLDSHESDLYAKVTDASRAIVARYEHRSIVTVFRHAVTGESWYDIPFAYAPWWERPRGCRQMITVTATCPQCGARFTRDCLTAQDAAYVARHDLCDACHDDDTDEGGEA